MAAPAFVPDASYQRALGAFTAEWAYAEAAVDMCNLVVLEAYGGRAIGDHLPTTIEERIDFFRKAHRTLPLLGPYARGGLPLIGRFAALRYDRHSLVTGLQLGFLAQLPADVQRTRCIPDSLFTEAKRFTEGEIDARGGGSRRYRRRPPGARGRARPRRGGGRAAGRERTLSRPHSDDRQSKRDRDDEDHGLEGAHCASHRHSGTRRTTQPSPSSQSFLRT
jgi:hypothetical protein